MPDVNLPRTMYRFPVLVGLIVILSVWLVLLFHFNQGSLNTAIDYYDVVSEVFAIAFVLLLLGVNLRFESESSESKLMFLGLCLMLIGHCHDLMDEFVFIRPDWLSLILENVCNNLGIVIIAIAVFKWSGRYQEQLELLKKQKKILTAASNTDPLTKLYNRRFLNNEFIQKILKGEDLETTTSLILMDLDNFKSVNDTYGHTTGDRLIVHLAEIIRTEIRDDDYAFRYGGEEFLIVLRGNTEVALRVAERIRTEYQTSTFLVDNDEVLSKSTSIGFYQLEPKVTFEQGLEIADRALYKAKSMGRNCSVQGTNEV